MKVAFLGTGQMGCPMALNVLRAGHELNVYNRTPGKTEPLVEEGATRFDTPADAARGCSVAITMLSDDEATRQVVLGGEEDTILPEEGLLEGLEPNGVHVAMSTISKSMAQTLADTHERWDQRYLSAPVFGLPEVARQANLAVAAAGSPQTIARVRPLFEAMGETIFEVGEEPWQANVVKLAANFTLASVIETLGESIAWMRKSDIDPHDFVEVINESFYESPMYEIYGGMIADQRYDPPEFRLSLGLKDVSLGLEAATDVEAPLPLGSLIRDHYLSAVANGEGDLDWAALGRLHARRAGLEE